MNEPVPEIVWQVRNWDATYENFKSRTVDECSFVCVPNKQHGMGFTRIITHPDGLAIYGVFQLVLGALSRQPRPRDGWLTDDGKKTGRSWNITDMALRWRRDTHEIGSAMGLLTDPSVGWIDTYERRDGQVSAKYPLGMPIMEGKEGKEGTGEKREALTPTLQQWLDRAQFIGYDPKEAATAWNGLEAVGWLKNGQAIKDWEKLQVVYRNRNQEREHLKRAKRKNVPNL